MQERDKLFNNIMQERDKLFNNIYDFWHKTAIKNLDFPIFHIRNLMHKVCVPLRPILSFTNHYSYRLAKFFIPFLTPNFTSPFVIKDTFSRSRTPEY